MFDGFGLIQIGNGAGVQCQFGLEEFTVSHRIFRANFDVSSIKWYGLAASGCSEDC
ncbi:hypothetical protein Cflav_PD6288 [Pedosphaera parvula Ellin514]|uniref:Uncharacterized protein n=1 Tax=Pedosphaera parvula (strain Ellin514) TaxID=320771 RepID=B9XD67_PEDPL|nr:hypothetical protein Cflav_PD6288 [Pedosphaera parvula Ellin514]